MLKRSNSRVGFARDLGYSTRVLSIATGCVEQRSALVVPGYAVLSPDGCRAVREDEGLYVCDGSSERRVADGGWGLAWSPDSTRFVYCCEDGLYVTDGTQGERVAEVGCSSAHWSPDGSMIAFAVWAEGVFVVNRDGTGLRRLVSGYAGDVNWAPDGSAVAYSDPGEGVFVVNLKGTVHRFTNHPEDGHPVWSPDGTCIAYSRWYPGEVRVVNTDGTGFLVSRDQPWDIAWAPDGRRVAYTSNGRYYRGERLVVVNVDTGDREVVGGAVGPVWLDSDHVAFLRWEGEVIGVRDDRGDERALFVHRKANARLSPNGEHVAYIDEDTDLGCVVVADSDGTNPLVLTVGETSGPMWSPDSTRVGWVHPGGVATVGVDGDHRLDFPIRTRWGGCCITEPVLSPDGTRLAYTTREGIVTTGPDGQEQQVINTEPNGSFEWSPDGTLLVTSG